MLTPAPCPFCKSPDVEAHDGHADITYIRCLNCGVIASFAPFLKGRKAIEAWNQRAE